MRNNMIASMGRAKFKDTNYLQQTRKKKQEKILSEKVKNDEEKVRHAPNVKSPT